MSVAVGAKVNGKVTGITNFGAFVDIGDGQTGLVHISEISDQFIKDIHDVLSVGDEVTVKVMTIKDGKMGLSIRKAADHPSEGGHEHGNREHAEREHSGRPQHRNFDRDNNHEGRGGDRRENHHGNSRGNFKSAPKGDDFDSLLSGFLKDSEQRLSTIRRNTEGKRGGRGGRRS
jgi:S1 RNA binding domain protein